MQKNKENLIQQTYGDRFIPIQVHKEVFHLEKNKALEDRPFSNYENLLNESILKTSSISKQLRQKVMNFSGKKSPPTSLLQKTLTKLPLPAQRKITQKRRISKKAYKVLQAPNLQDNFYLNLLDWSQDNHIAVALESELYVWAHHSTYTEKVYQSSGEDICSVCFCGNGLLAVGNAFGQVKIVDSVKKRKVASWNEHSGRVGSLDWGKNILASGSKDGYVNIWDLRIRKVVNKYQAHTQEICGLRWSPDGRYIASGGNDNKLTIYSQQKNSELIKFHQHTAAIKAIGWCHSNPSMIASGGGTADKNIRFFSTNSLQQNFHIDTGSQICNLLFSKISNEIITTHGYSLNQVNLWSTNSNWQTLESVQLEETLIGHNSRVLYLADSPDGSAIVTGAGDQTLRFWNVFDNNRFGQRESLGMETDLR